MSSTERRPGSTATDITAEEMFKSLTGYDEIAITRAFGGEDLNVLRKRPFTFLRALVFVHQRREGLKDAAAKDSALNLTLEQVQDYFANDEEVMPEEPVTEPGKDAEPSN